MVNTLVNNRRARRAEGSLDDLLKQPQGALRLAITDSRGAVHEAGEAAQLAGALQRGAKGCRQRGGT